MTQIFFISKKIILKDTYFSVSYQNHKNRSIRKIIFIKFIKKDTWLMQQSLSWQSGKCGTRAPTRTKLNGSHDNWISTNFIQWFSTQWQLYQMKYFSPETVEMLQQQWNRKISTSERPESIMAKDCQLNQKFLSPRKSFQKHQ